MPSCSSGMQSISRKGWAENLQCENKRARICHTGINEADKNLRWISNGNNFIELSFKGKIQNIQLILYDFYSCPHHRSSPQ